LWPKVEFAKDVGAPLGKRAVGRQKKNRIKSCLEGGSGKKPQKSGRILIRGKCKCPNCGELGHRKNSPKCPLNGTKKRQEPTYVSSCSYVSFILYLCLVHLVRKGNHEKMSQKIGFLGTWRREVHLNNKSTCPQYVVQMNMNQPHLPKNVLAKSPQGRRRR